MRRRFSTRNNNTIQPGFILFYIFCYGIEWNAFKLVRLPDQVGGMTIWTSQITMGEEDNRNNIPLPLYQTAFYKTFYCYRHVVTFQKLKLIITKMFSMSTVILFILHCEETNNFFSSHLSFRILLMSPCQFTNFRSVPVVDFVVRCKSSYSIEI